MGDWIEIPNWERFQHYKDRDPPWIKNYTRLLHKEEYLELSLSDRGLLHGIWLAYAATGCQVRTGPEITSWLRQSPRNASLERLNEAGFIVVSASKPLRAKGLLRNPQRERGKNADAPRSLEKRLSAALADAADLAGGWNGGDSDAFELALDEVARRHGVGIPYRTRDELWDTVIRR